MKQLTVICPVLNEVAHLDTLIHSLCSGDGTEKEVLLVDGGSTDGSQEKIDALMEKFPDLRMIHNAGRTATAAFNLGAKESESKYVAFVGAHASYPPDYFSNALKNLEAGECDVVGGPLYQTGRSPMGKAIARVMSSRYGVGNTEFRTSDERMYVDSVAFAVYRRSIFEQSGLMDISLPVNQDDEFHYRLNSLGYRILMVPEMRATYFVRENLSALSKQYFNYGFYKPAVFRKVKGSRRMRHLIPAMFVMYLLSLPLAFITPLWLLPLFVYLVLITGVSISFKAPLGIRLRCIAVFPVLHISYGAGFLAGIFR